MLSLWLKVILHLSMSVFIVIESTNNANANEDQNVGKLRYAADLHFTKGEFDNSIQVWSKVIAMEPENDANYYKRFRVYLKQMKYREALADLSSALTINPKNENALAQRANLQMRLGKCAEAEKDYADLKR